MAMTLKQIREQYPQYNDMTDTQLADALHSKLYSDLPKEQVYEKLQVPMESKPMELTLNKGAQKQGADWRGLASDTLHMLGSALKGGTQFALKAPGNIAEIGSELMHHPLSYSKHALGQVLAGVVGGTRDVANIPHKIFDELADRKITPNWLRTGSIPEDTGLEGFLGLEPTKKSDELLRALPALYGAGKLVAPVAKKITKAIKAPDLKQVIRDTQAKVNAVDKNLGKAFDTIESEVEKRGVGNIPVSKDVISSAEKFLEKTPEAKDLIKRAKTGEYKALRELQADLRQIGETALSNKLTTERKVGKEALSARKQINEAIEQHFDTSEHKDLAKLLKETKEGYANLQNTYFSNPALAKVFGKSQKVPKNPLTLLTEESTEMKKFFDAHPEVQKMMEKALSHGKKKKAALIAGGILGSGTTAGITSHYLK